MTASNQAKGQIRGFKACFGNFRKGGVDMCLVRHTEHAKRTERGSKCATIPSRVTVTSHTGQRVTTETEQLKKSTTDAGQGVFRPTPPQRTTGHPVRPLGPLGVFYLNFTNLFRFQHAQNHPAGCYCKKCPRFPKRGPTCPLTFKF